MKVSCSSHHEYLFNRHSFESKAEQTIEAFKALRKKMKIDAIAFRGISGCSMGFLLSFHTGVPMLFVRKGEKSYSSYTSEGLKGDLNYLIVDDLICSGDTAEAIRKEVESFGGTVIGALLYNDGSYPHFQEV